MKSEERNYTENVYYTFILQVEMSRGIIRSFKETLKITEEYCSKNKILNKCSHYSLFFQDDKILLFSILQSNSPSLFLLLVFDINLELVYRSFAHWGFQICEFP